MRKIDRTGESFVNKQGLSFTIVNYVNSKETYVKFEGSDIISKTSYVHCKEGAVKPTFKQEMDIKYNGKIKIVGEYINNSTEIEIECGLCGLRVKRLPCTMKKGKFKCSCQGGITKWDTPSVKEAVELNRPNIIVIGEYRGMTVPILCTCRVHSDFQWETIPHNLVRKTRANLGCPICEGSLGENGESFGTEWYNNKLLKRFGGECKLLSDYENDKTKVKVGWKNCEHEYWVDPYYQANTSKECRVCRAERLLSKEKWRTTEYFRRRIPKWLKQEIIENQHNKCWFTGENLKVANVHHIYNFKDILEDTHKKLEIDFKEKLENYSNEEIEVIVKSLIEFHMNNKHLLVAIEKDLHDEFHKTYGYYDNNIEQLNNFKEFINLKGVVV